MDTQNESDEKAAKQAAIFRDSHELQTLAYQ